jgi:hypothetical protein
MQGEPSTFHSEDFGLHASFAPATTPRSEPACRAVFLEDPIDDPDERIQLRRAGSRPRPYPVGTENGSIFATVRGSIPNRRAVSRRLSPCT